MIPGDPNATYYYFDGEELVNGIWEPMDPNRYSSLGFGKFRPFKGTVTEELLKTLYIFPDSLSGGDYSESSGISFSNHRVFIKEFGKVKGVHDLHSGWGSFGVAIRADIVESHEGIKEILDGLENYPLIDEDDLSELTNEWEQEAVKDMIHGVQHAIENDLDELLEDTDIDSDVVETLIWDGINELNLDWTYESNSAYMDKDRVTPYVEDRVLIDNCKDLPLLIDRKWSCNQTHNLYEQKFKEMPV